MPRVVVAQILSSYQIGGAEMVALELCRRMDRSRFRPIAISLRSDGPMRQRFHDANVEALAVEAPAASGIDWRRARRLATLLKSIHADVAHCHNRYANIYGALGASLAGVPAVTCTRHAAPPTRAPWRTTLVERAVAPLTDYFVAVCRTVLDDAVRAGRIPQNRCGVIYNGVDVERFQPRTPEQRPRTRILCVARLSPEKCHRILLDAAHALVQRGREFEVLLAGDGPECGALEAQVRRLGIARHVSFLGMRSDVPELMRQADIFALSSATEGLPMTVIEAMAAELPVVATAVSGVPEVVRDGETGLLVPPLDADRLTEALDRLLIDPDLRLRMGVSGRRTVLERFDLAHMARQHEELYLRLLARPRRRLSRLIFPRQACSIKRETAAT